MRVQQERAFDKNCRALRPGTGPETAPVSKLQRVPLSRVTQETLAQKSRALRQSLENARARFAERSAWARAAKSGWQKNVGRAAKTRAPGKSACPKNAERSAQALDWKQHLPDNCRESGQAHDPGKRRREICLNTHQPKNKSNLTKCSLQETASQR